MPEQKQPSNPQTPADIALEIESEMSTGDEPTDSSGMFEDPTATAKKGREALAAQLASEGVDDEVPSEEEDEGEPSEDDADPDPSEDEGGEDEIAQLRATVETLLEKIEALTEGTQQPSQQKEQVDQQAPAVDISFTLSDDEFDDLTTDRQGAERVLGNKLKAISQNISQGVTQSVLTKAVSTLVPTVQQMVRYTMAYENFRTANADLMSTPEMAEFTGLYVGKVQQEHPKWAPEQIMSEAAKRVRTRLKLEGPKPSKAKDPDDVPVPPTKTPKGSGRQPVKKKPTGLQGELDREAAYSLRHPGMGMM